MDAAATSGSPDAGTCFGIFAKICLASTPTMPFTVSTASNVDTDSPLCASTVSGATNYCVIAGTNITIGATLRATGTKPLVLIAADSIVTTALIDVGSYRDATSGVTGDRTRSLLGAAIGAGANPSSCAPAMLPIEGGGYAGGSFIGFGGVGGTGSNGSTSGSPAPPVTDAPVLRGGCSASVDPISQVGGYGGGAVLLIAGTRIDVQGGINASGASARGAAPGNKGGFGGGAGGMIAFDAPTITCNSLLLASGGGGGGGSSGITSGGDGQDPTTLAAAAGGRGANGGNGGNGSTASTRAAPGAPGAPGNPAGIGGGGGGGGGGAGLIKAPASANLGTMVSPPPTP